eukprot:1717105-Pyramimonas_sp.AAC.1
MRGAPDGCAVNEDLACPVVCCMDGPLTLELPCVESRNKANVVQGDASVKIPHTSLCGIRKVTPGAG